MSDTSADAGVVQSRVQLERLVAEDELAGRTIAGFAAQSVGLRAIDLDGVTISRLDLRGCDGDDSRLERAQLELTDLRTSQWKGALWHRVRAKDCDLTELDLSGFEGTSRAIRATIIPPSSRCSTKRPSPASRACYQLGKGRSRP